MRKQILDIQDAANIVGIILINRNTTVIIFHDTFQNLRISTVNIQIYYILSARHYLFGSLITKADNTLQHALFVLDIILVSQLQSLFQIINTQDVIFLLHYFFGKHSTFQEHIFQRPENLTGNQNASNKTPAEK